MLKINLLWHFTENFSRNVKNNVMSNNFDTKFQEKILENASMFDNHTDVDCIMVIVLSHGEQGILYASDKPYKTDKLW